MALMCAATSVAAADRTGIQIDRLWAQLIAPGQNSIAVYTTIVSIPGDTLTSVSSPDATRSAIYLTLMKGGQASLYEVDGGLPLAPNQPLLMGPRGTQIRLTGIKQDIAVGHEVTIVLNFARAGTKSIVVPVASPGAADPTP